MSRPIIPAPSDVNGVDIYNLIDRSIPSMLLSCCKVTIETGVGPDENQTRLSPQIDIGLAEDVLRGLVKNATDLGRICDDWNYRLSVLYQPIGNIKTWSVPSAMRQNTVLLERGEGEYVGAVQGIADCKILAETTGEKTEIKLGSSELSVKKSKDQEYVVNVTGVLENYNIRKKRNGGTDADTGNSYPVHTAIGGLRDTYPSDNEQLMSSSSGPQQPDPSGPIDQNNVPANDDMMDHDSTFSEVIDSFKPTPRAPQPIPGYQRADAPDPIEETNPNPNDDIADHDSTFSEVMDSFEPSTRDPQPVTGKRRRTSAEADAGEELISAFASHEDWAEILGQAFRADADEAGSEEKRVQRGSM